MQIEAIVEKLVEAEYVVNLGVSSGVGLDRYRDVSTAPEHCHQVRPEGGCGAHVGLASEGSPKWDSPRSEERRIVRFAGAATIKAKMSESTTSNEWDTLEWLRC